MDISGLTENEKGFIKLISSAKSTRLSSSQAETGTKVQNPNEQNKNVSNF
jgi:hypothetical protein